MASRPQHAHGTSDTSTLAVDLLALGCDVPQLNALVIALRNAGIAVHADRAPDPEGLVALLQAAPRDLLLIDTDQATDPAAIAQSARSVDPDVAIILVSKDPAAAVRTAAEIGARDTVTYVDTDRLALVVQREYHARKLARDLATTRRLLAEAEDRNNALINTSSDAFAYVHHGMHVRANPAYVSLFGFTDMADLEGLPIMDLLAPAERKHFKGVLRDIDHSPGIHQVETVAQSEAGESFPVKMTFCPARVDGEPCTQVLVHDLRPTAAQRLAQQDAGSAAAPSGTACLTKADYLAQLEARLTAADGAGLAVLLLELRQPGQLQQQLGLMRTAAGLQELVEGLASFAGAAQGCIGRLGDFQFTLCCDTAGAPQELSTRFVETLERASAGLRHEGADPVFLLGMAVADTPGTQPQELLQRCRDAMQPLSAWHQGTANLAAASETRPEVDEAMVALIDRALETDGFRLKYQPIVSLQGDTREHYAVLLRLLDQDQSELPPEAFMTHAEHAGRLTAIDRWVVRNCSRELAAQRQDGRKIVFYVVLSQAAITDETFLLWVCDCLREFKAKGSWLTFQFKDRDLLAQTEAARHLAEGLKKVNCGIALDRYDCKPEAESLLDILPLDAVKFSPDCLVDLATSNERQNHLAEINKKLQARGLKTVATAVEDANSLAVLWNIGVNYIQGYFLQEPSNSITYEYDS